MPLTYEMLSHASIRRRASRTRNVVGRGSGSGYGLPQSDTQWNLKSPTSTNTPRCAPAMAVGEATAGSLAPEEHGNISSPKDLLVDAAR
jgi:hypothetical protein